MKKQKQLNITFLILCMLCCILLSPCSVAAAVKEDLNKDNIVDTKDILYLRKALLGISGYTVVDLNSSGTTDMIDVLYLTQYTTKTDPSGDPFSNKKAQSFPTPAAVTTPKYTPTVQTSTVSDSTYMAKIKVKNTKTGKIYTGETKAKLQLAVTAVVKYELGNSLSAQKSTEAWKAQAVLCYTNIASTCQNGSTFDISLGQDVDLTIANDKKIYDAVGTVLGQKLMISGKELALSFYSAYGAGSSASCGKYYVQDLPYLKAVYSPETTSLITKYYGSNAFTATKTASLNQLIKDLSAKVGYDVKIEYKAGYFNLFCTSWDGCYVWKTNLYYTKSGGKVYITGKQIREVLGLKSSSFIVTKQSGDTLTITTRGYGHGIGMSQIGAVIYANEYGWNYKQILAQYYSITSTSTCQIYGAKW